MSKFSIDSTLVASLREVAAKESLKNIENIWAAYDLLATNGNSKNF